jgi:K+-sensing histidine kinase KdpD
MKDLSLHILDIAQNSVSAGASLIEIKIFENPVEDKYEVTIKDNGKGMNSDTLQKATDPFFTSRTTRNVGLGLPLLKQNAERTGGSFELNSKPDEGTVVEALFGFKHIDRLPLGDIGGVIAILASANPQLDFTYTHQTAEESFSFDTRDVKAELDGLPISNAKVSQFIKEMINENTKAIMAS